MNYEEKLNCICNRVLQEKNTVSNKISKYECDLKSKGINHINSHSIEDWCVTELYSRTINNMLAFFTENCENEGDITHWFEAIGSQILRDLVAFTRNSISDEAKRREIKFIVEVGQRIKDEWSINTAKTLSFMPV